MQITLNRFSSTLIILPLFTTCCLLSSATAWQDDKVAAETTASSSYQAGLEQITERRVLSTISFLASDELAGRGTNTTEFNIAAAYIASRFRGADLEGGAADGGFYHETPMRMVQTPNAPDKFEDAQAKPLSHFGLLAGGPEAFDHSGAVSVVDDLNESLPAGLDGVVIAKYPGDAKGPRVSAQVHRFAQNLKDAGAKALLLAIPSDSDLIEQAKVSRDKARPESPRNRFAIPVLLISETMLTQLKEQLVRLSVPAEVITEPAMRNVIGVLRGTDPELSKEAILFSAHLDHLGSRPSSGDGIYNGADDDASGCTAVVTLADAFAAMPRPKRSLIFMTYWGEESGLLGSKQFVLKPSWPLEKIKANVNIEMIGRPEAGARGKIWMTGWSESNLGVLMAQAAEPFGVEIFDHPKFGAQLYNRSDNWSFAEKGVIAHSFSAGSLHSDYHQPNDEWDRLELPHMTRVIQGLFVASLPFADGAATPAKSK